MRKFLKISGLSIVALLVVFGAYLGLLHYPGILFAHQVDYKNFRVHSQHALNRGDLELILDEVDAALRTSDIYDSTISHDILFGNNNRTFAIVQDIAWWILIREGRPVFTYNRSYPPHVSQAITFRIPDFGRDLLIHPDARYEMPLTHDLTHEVTHTLVTADIGIQRLPSLPEWKGEGYAEYVASSRRIFSNPSYQLSDSVAKILEENLFSLSDNDFPSAQQACRARPAIQDEVGNHRRACYYVYRVLVEFLLDFKGISVDELMDPNTSAAATFQELVSAYRAGLL